MPVALFSASLTVLPSPAVPAQPVLSGQIPGGPLVLSVPPCGKRTVGAFQGLVLVWAFENFCPDSWVPLVALIVTVIRQPPAMCTQPV